MELQYIVELVYDGTEEVEKQIDCGNSMRKAEKVRDALSINLDHNNYSVFITIRQVKQ